MSMKKIYISLCLVFIQGMMFQSLLKGLGVTNMMKNPKQYENYLVIKYLIHLTQV